MLVPVMAVGIDHVLLAQMELVQLVKASRSFSKELAADTPLVPRHHELTDTSTQEAS